MFTRSALLFAALLCASSVIAQSGSQTNFQISATSPWTDTGLDLKSGDAVQISTKPGPAVPDRHALPGVTTCDAKGTGAAGTPDLPLPTAPVGTLIARLNAQGAAPVLIGAEQELRIEEPSHLFLGMNVNGNQICPGAIEVQVTVNGAPATGGGTSIQGQAANNTQATTNAGSGTAAPATTQTSRGEQLKSQLASAAQVFLSGQFGVNKDGSTSASSSSTAVSTAGTSDANGAEAALKISESPLDSDLRKDIDSLPRRVNDQFQNLGDMVNFVVVGSQKDVQSALEAASWHVADTSNENAVVNAIQRTYDKQDYLAMPMSTLFLFGRKQDFGYEMAEPIAMVASRHHFRIWKAPFTWKGQEVWVGAGTHDIGFAKDKRNGSVTHKIDPAVDGERDNIGSSLQKANKAKTLSYYLPPNPVQDAKNATGDGYRSDGRLLVIFLQ